MAGNLTPAQQHFADEWLIDHNGTRAYKVAYPQVKKDKTAQVNASRMLSNAMVQAYIKAKQSEIAAKYEITQERILKEESCISYSDVTEILKTTDPTTLPERVRRAISSIKVKDLPDGTKEYEYKLWDKGASLKRVSKHLGLYEADNNQQGPSLQDLYATMFGINPELAEAIKAQWEQSIE